MIKRVKLETIYKMAKEDNEKIKDRKLFPDGWDEKVYDYYNKLSKESSDVEMFMEFLGGEDSPLEMAYAYRRNMYIILYFFFLLYYCCSEIFVLCSLRRRQVHFSNFHFQPSFLSSFKYVFVRCVNLYEFPLLALSSQDL